MKIINFQGGLGNQMFIYVFYLWMKRTHSGERIYGSYWSGSLRTHTDFLLSSIFGVELPPHNLLTDTISHCASIMQRLHIVSRDENEHSIFYDGFWLDRKYSEGLDLANVFKFRNVEMDERNAAVRDEIVGSNSVSLHVRRGDYYDDEHKNDFGAYSTQKYYTRAIEMELKDNPSAHFFVFSDDIEWAKANIKVPRATFVSGNSGNDSWKDMHLMSLCRHNIIANSTFSWWAASLNKNDGRRVFYPQKWYAWENPDIFPSTWTPVENV